MLPLNASSLLDFMLFLLERQKYTQKKEKNENTRKHKHWQSTIDHHMIFNPPDYAA